MNVVFVLASVMTGGVFALSARADDVRKHCVLDWAVKAPAVSTHISPGDLYDRLRYSTGAAPFTYSAVSDDTAEFQLPDGTACQPDPIRVVTDEEVEFPVLHTKKTVPFVRFTQPEYTDGSGKKYIRSQKITADNQVSPLVTNELTIVTRFRWGGPIAGKYRWSIFGYGWAWSAGTGVNIMIGEAGSTSNGFPALYIGNGGPYYFYPNSDKSFLIAPNLWYDMAISVRQFTEDQVLKTELSVHWCSPTKEKNQIKSDTKIVTGVPAISFTGSRNWISSQDSAALKEKSSSDERHFRGDIQRISVYSKALTADEARQAFVGENEMISLGVKNDKADEFSDAGTGEFNADTMAWCQFRKTLTADKRSVTIRKTLDSRWAQKPHVLRFGLLPDVNIPPAGAFLRLSVNGQKVGVVKVEQAGSNYCVCLPAKVMKTVTEDGDWQMNLKIEQEPKLDPFAGAVKFDYLTLGGPWQIGIADNKSDEFVTAAGNYVRYHVATWDEKQCSASTISTGGADYVPQKFYFTLTDDEARNLDLTLGYRSCSVTKWKLIVNGEDYDTRFWDTNGARFTNYTWTFPKGTLKEGLNCFELDAPGPKEWNNHDALWLGVEEFYPGSLYTGSLGTGLMLLLR